MDSYGTIMMELAKVNQRLRELLGQAKVTQKEWEDVKNQVRCANDLVISFKSKMTDEQYHQALKLIRKNVELVDNTIVKFMAIEEEQNENY